MTDILFRRGNMTADSSRPAIPDISVAEEELALAFKTISGALLLFDGLIVIFVPIGLRSGSLFWLYWVLVQGMIAMAFLGYAFWLDHRGTSRVGSVHAPAREQLSGGH
jgi:hypothetical protein